MFDLILYRRHLSTFKVNFDVHNATFSTPLFSHSLGRFTSKLRSLKNPGQEASQKDLGAIESSAKVTEAWQELCFC
jgi:hypothetical protein